MPSFHDQKSIDQFSLIILGGLWPEKWSKIFVIIHIKQECDDQKNVAIINRPGEAGDVLWTPLSLIL